MGKISRKTSISYYAENTILILNYVIYSPFLLILNCLVSDIAPTTALHLLICKKILVPTTATCDLHSDGLKLANKKVWITVTSQAVIDPLYFSLWEDSIFFFISFFLLLFFYVSLFSIASVVVCFGSFCMGDCPNMFIWFYLLSGYVVSLAI